MFLQVDTSNDMVATSNSTILKDLMAILWVNDSSYETIHNCLNDQLLPLVPWMLRWKTAFVKLFLTWYQRSFDHWEVMEAPYSCFIVNSVYLLRQNWKAKPIQRSRVERLKHYVFQFKCVGYAQLTVPNKDETVVWCLKTSWAPILHEQFRENSLLLLAHTFCITSHVRL